MSELFYFIFNKLSNGIVTILLLILAFVAAWLVKRLLLKFFKVVKAEALLSKLGVKDAVINSFVQFIAKLAYLITFLLFLPGVLDRLGMSSVSHPITGLVNTFIALVPKLVASGIILAVGFFIANIVRDLLTTVLKAVKVDAIQEKAGISASENASFSHIIANIIYALILLLVIISAIDQLGIATISDPANMVVTAIFNMLPNVLAAIVIITVGVFIAKLVATLLESLLAGIGADTLLEKITGKSCEKVVVSKLLSRIVNGLIVLIFLVQGINVLQLPVFTEIGVAIIGYIPEVISVLLILAFAVFSANTIETLLIKKYPSARASGIAAKAAVYALAFFLCLSQLGIAPVIVETTFILIVAALAVAFVIAFGIGGRSFAANTLDKLEKKLEGKDEKEQSVE